MLEFMHLAFIMCTEGGQLEQESLLMVESLHRFGDSLKDGSIYSFQVGEKNGVSTPTLKTLINLLNINDFISIYSHIIDHQISYKVY